MGLKKLFFLTVFWGLFLLYAHADPLHVMVVGGGPAGLAIAIEAHLLGSEVTIIEKRENYTRQNILFLDESSLNLLNKWLIKIPEMTILDFQGKKRSFVLLKDLENALAKEVQKLGIKIVHGEFQSFIKEKKTIAITTSREELILPYDILIASDGAHSQVRETLGISCSIKGKGIGAIAVIPCSDPSGRVEVEKIETSHFFAKKIHIPVADIILLQNHPPLSIQTVSKKELIHLSLELGWADEATRIEQDHALILDNIDISLQQATTFSDWNKDVILLGDSAGCTSFLEGMGVNTAFTTSQFAADFILHFKKDPKKAHLIFNQAMSQIIESVLLKNEHLFLIPSN